MIIHLLVLAAGVAVAEPPAKPARSTPQDLAAALSKLRRAHESKMRESVMGGGAEELRDAISAGPASERKKMADRLPGMAADPFHVCRRLEDCKNAPVSIHVEDQTLADDAFLALARPWYALQDARGKAVKLSVDPGTGVKLELEDMPSQPTIQLAAIPAPTGGFDVTVEDGEKAAKAFADARAGVLAAK